jgi:hypothetical protein
MKVKSTPAFRLLNNGNDAHVLFNKSFNKDMPVIVISSWRRPASHGIKKH